MMTKAFVHRYDRIAFTIGSYELAWYDFMAICVPIFGFLLWYWQARRGGISRKLTWIALPWIVGCLFLGIRLFHCLIYAPDYYFAEPIRFLEIWNGGFASHGALVGVAIGFYTYTRKYGLPFVETFDRFCFSGAAGAALVRVGNFFNSEIVGRQTEVPWGMRFIRYDSGRFVRHPTQLYECALALFALLVLVIADQAAGKEKRPPGLMLGLVITIYFGGRFFIEFFKEYQTRIMYKTNFTMGHMLTIPAVLVGLWILAKVWKRYGNG